MAIRRVSELPNLNMATDDANLSEIDKDRCLIEVSYDKDEGVYKSFYITIN